MEDVSFDTSARFMLRYHDSNDGFYFDRHGFVLDFVIRKARPKNRHFSTYYTDRIRRRVACKYRRQVDEFGYRFEES